MLRGGKEDSAMTTNEPYDIEEPAMSASPALPGEVEIRGNADELFDLLAAELLIAAEQHVHLGNEFNLAVCGSRSIERFIERLMYDPDMRSFPWERTHCWLLDDTNAGVRFQRLCDTLIPHSGIGETNLHATSSAMEIAGFDFTLLDVGADGRIGGLLPKPSGENTCVPAATINQSTFLALVAMGSEVQEMLHSLADSSEETLPVQGIQSCSGVTKWYLSPTTPEDELKPWPG